MITKYFHAHELQDVDQVPTEHNYSHLFHLTAMLVTILLIIMLSTQALEATVICSVSQEL